MCHVAIATGIPTLGSHSSSRRGVPYMPATRRKNRPRRARCCLVAETVPGKGHSSVLGLDQHQMCRHLRPYMMQCYVTVTRYRASEQTTNGRETVGVPSYLVRASLTLAHQLQAARIFVKLLTSCAYTTKDLMEIGPLAIPPSLA